LGEPLRSFHGVPSALVGCSRRAIRSITFALRFARARWFRYYPSRFGTLKNTKKNIIFPQYL
jgi:hypothetical protein